jgi:hypothetical protein
MTEVTTEAVKEAATKVAKEADALRMKEIERQLTRQSVRASQSLRRTCRALRRE